MDIKSLSFTDAWMFAIVSLLLRYIVFAVVTYWIFYVIGKKKMSHLKIQSKAPSNSFILQEIKTSLLVLLILGGLAVSVIYLIKNGNSHFYYDISEYGYFYFGFSIFLMMFIHDTWFYWIHRWMHVPKLYAIFHKVHHKSLNPTPFTSFSMDWTEALLEFGIFPIIVLILPVHPSAFITFTFLAFGFNIMGHLGYELIPKSISHSMIGKFINTSTHHNLHHSKFDYNYSYYFTFWDKICGTEKLLEQTVVKKKHRVLNLAGSHTVSENI